MNSDDATGGDEPRRTLPELIVESWAREVPSLDQHGFALTLRIRALALVIDHEIARIAASRGIQAEDVLLLSALRRTGSPYRLRPTEIYKLLNITSGAATARIARLVHKGLAERVADPDDRRSALVQITPAGIGAIDGIMKESAVISGHALTEGKLDDQALAELKNGLGKLERGWEAVVPIDDNPLARQERRHE